MSSYPVTRAISGHPLPVYEPPKYLCVYRCLPKSSGLNTEYLYRTLDASGLMTLVLNAEVCGIDNIHLYLIRHDKPPLPVDYMLHGNRFSTFTRSGNYIERRFT